MNTIKNKPSLCQCYIFGDNNQIIFSDGSVHFQGQLHIGFGDCPVYNSSILIGKNTTSNGVLMRIGESNSHIKIGDDCMFSENISIMASDTHAIVDELGNVVNVGKTIEIGNHVWVGMNSLILKNSKIMNNSIIGAQSVVTGIFDKPNVIIAGSPAKIVKDIHSWKRDRPEQLLRRV